MHESNMKGYRGGFGIYTEKKKIWNIARNY